MNRTLLIILVLCIATLSAQTVVDTTKAVQTPAFGKTTGWTPPPAPKLPVNMFKYTLSLLFVFALIYAFYYFLRRFSMPVQFMRGRSDAELRVLEVLHLTPKHRLYVVVAYGQVYILSVSPEHIEVVDRVTDPETIQRLLAPRPDPFRDKLNTWLKRPKSTE
jgi:flagellar biosynthetic protein FliO